MADATVLPSYANNKFFFWNTYLTNSLDNSISATTIEWGSIPEDVSGQVTGAFLIAVKNVRRNPNRIELMWVPASSVSADGFSATVVRGLDPSGLDYTTGSADYVYDFDAGDEVFCAILPQDGELFRAVMQGIIGTGGNQFMLGDETAGIKTYGVYTNQGFKGILRGTGALTEWSNGDGVWTAIADTSASVVTKVSAADTTASYLNSKIDVATDGELTKAIGNAGGNETLQLGLATTLTKAEMDQLAGISANVTDTNLNTLTAGAASNADALHTHSGLGVVSVTFGEAIDGSTTPKAGFISPGVTSADAFPLQVQETNNAAGVTTYGVNWSCQTFTTSTYQTVITQIDLLLLKLLSGAAGEYRIYAVDGSHKPTGSVLASGAVTAVSVSSSNQDWKSLTLASPLTVTGNTEYAIVFLCIAGTATDTLSWRVGSGDTYSGGQAFTSADAGATWSSAANDFAFRVWGYEPQTAGQVYMTDKDEPFRGMFDGFAFSNTAAGATGSFRMEGVQTGFTGLTAGATYHTSGTIGGVDTSTTGLKIGKAIGTTSIEIEKAGGFVDIALQTSSTFSSTGTAAQNLLLGLGKVNPGFRPSKIEVQGTITQVVGGTTTTKMFWGSLEGGNTLEYTSTATLTGLAVVSTVSGLSISAVTMGSFAFTDTGFTYTLTASALTSGSASLQAVCYR